MNTSRFTPPILRSRGLQIKMNEAPGESQRIYHAHSIAFAILFLIIDILFMGFSSSDSCCLEEDKGGEPVKSPRFSRFAVRIGQIRTSSFNGKIYSFLE